MNDNQNIIRDKKILYACRSAIVAWILLFMAICLTIFAFISHIEYLTTIPFALFFIAAINYIISAFIIKCSNCNKKTLVQGSTPPKYVDKNKIWGVMGWSGIVLNVVINKKYTCMHCGKKFKVSN